MADSLMLDGPLVTKPEARCLEDHPEVLGCHKLAAN